MTDMSYYNSNYPVNGIVKSKVEPEQISGGGNIYILNENSSPFGHGLMYVDKSGNEHMLSMTRDAYHQLLGEMVRWLR